MSVITYDRPVKDLIAGLNATGHVTHVEHRKSKVTIHHNAGRLSHEGVLKVWETRPASAHFDVDLSGDVAQYVKANEYAWACGVTLGNQQSMSIEMANSGVGGNWPVSETTWRSAARLAGWLFARVIGERPRSDTLVGHSYWKSTECPGTFLRGMLPEIVHQAQLAHDYFVGEMLPWLQEGGDMSTYLVRGDSELQVPGKSYTFGNLYFMVRTDPSLPTGAVRRYVPASGVQRAVEKMQGGVIVIPQQDLNDIPYVPGGEPPPYVLGQ